MSTITPYIEEFLERTRLDNKSLRTQVSYKNKLEEFDQIITEIKGESFDINSLTHKDLQKYIDILFAQPNDINIKNGRGNKSSSVENKFITAKTFCKYLYNDEVLDSDITVVPRNGKFKLPKKPKRVTKKLSMEEYQQMLDNITWKEGQNNIYDGFYVSLRNKCLLSLILTSGLRRDEILSLKWDNIYNGFINVIGKGNKERKIPVHPTTDIILKEWKDELNKRVSKKELNNEDNLVFPSNRLTRITDSTYWIIVQKALQTIGRQKYLCDDKGNDLLDQNGEKIINKQALNPHGLRRSMASQLHKQKIPIETIADLLGHQDTKTSLLYIGIDEEDTTEAINSIPINLNRKEGNQ